MKILIIFLSLSLVTNVIESKAIKCRYDEVLTTLGSCDGSCDDPAPACAFTKSLNKRCGCQPGKVRNRNGYCSPIYMCELKPDLPTQCEVERLFNENVRCNKSGDFERKQKRGSIYTCVVPETGNSIPGKSSTDAESLNCQDFTRCQIRWARDNTWNLHQPYLMDGPFTQCSDDGNFFPSECDFFGRCKCIVPETGTIIPGPSHFSRAYQTCSTGLTPCQKQFVETDEANLNSPPEFAVPLPRCSYIDGNFETISCDQFDSCHCLNRITGVPYPGEGVLMDCNELTACQKQFTEGRDTSEAFPCDDDGRYLSRRCNETVCFCVDLDTGDQIIQGPTEEILEELVCPTPACPSNMEYQTCAGCDITCDNKDKLFMCLLKCRSKCACPQNKVWNKSSGMCVEPADCVAPLIPPVPPFNDYLIPPPINGNY